MKFISPTAVIPVQYSIEFKILHPQHRCSRRVNFKSFGISIPKFSNYGSDPNATARDSDVPQWMPLSHPLWVGPVTASNSSTVTGPMPSQTFQF